LDEVVIIGYGTTTVKDATGSVAAVTSEDFNSGVISSPEQLIQGKTAGVQITQTSGEPGAGIEFRIRGTNSVRSNNNPLFVVDGVPLANDDTAAGGADIGFGTSKAKNPLNFLNPSDIESISVLKDASATAIYGSRGANGVVIITTKSGKGAGPGGVLEYSSSLSISTPAESYDLLKPQEFLAAVTQFGGDASAQNFGNTTDWQEYVTKTAVSQNQNLSYSQNYGSGNIRGTFGYGKQFGVIQNSSLERITGRINVNHRFFEDKLALTLQATISRVNDESAPNSGSAGFQGDILGAAYSANPTWPTNPDFVPGGQLSPASMLTYIQQTSNTDRGLVNFSAEYAFIPELKGKVNLGYDKSKSGRTGVSSPKALNLGRGTFGNGRGALNQIDVENRLLEATLNYNKDFGNSRLDALVGYSFQDFNRKGRNIEAWGFQTSDLNQMGRDIGSSASMTAQAISGDYQQFGYDFRNSNVFVNRLFPDPVTNNVVKPATSAVRSLAVNTFDNTDELQSFFGRINLSLADKYLFTATVRAVGSSRFGADNQYGIFPSGAFAWKINEENFIGDAVSTLKLRLGYGITGNQEGLGY
jgi:iron complex outermembrane receptor protein